MPAQLNLALPKGFRTPESIADQLIQSHGQHKSANQRLAKDMEKAVRQDCKNNYAHLGLLAVPLLLRDAMSSDGCKW